MEQVARTFEACPTTLDDDLPWNPLKDAAACNPPSTVASWRRNMTPGMYSNYQLPAQISLHCLHRVDRVHK